MDGLAQQIETLDGKYRIIKQEYGNRFWENRKIVIGKSQNGQVSTSASEIIKTSGDNACSGVDHKQPLDSEHIKNKPKKVCRLLKDQPLSVSTEKNRKTKSYEKKWKWNPSLQWIFEILLFLNLVKLVKKF